MKIYRITASGLLLTLAAGIVPARANLVTNPGFENCVTEGQSPPPGWTSPPSNAVICTQVSPHSGTWSAEFDVSGATLSQSIPTTAGDTYDFSFWLENGTTPPTSFTAAFGADKVLDLNVFPFPYTFEDFTVTAAAASTTISFTGSPGLFSAGWNLDDVSVVAVTPAPEPASLALVATGLFGLFALRRRESTRRQ